MGEEKFDIVDNDLDFWVKANYTEWPMFCQRFTQQLIDRGWSQCALHIDHEGASPYRIPRIIICERTDPFFIVDVMPFDVLHDQLIDTKVCDSSEPTLFPHTWRKIKY